MNDFFWEDAEEVQDARQRRRICAQGGNNERKHVLPLGHLDSQVRQAHAELQPDGLRTCMKGRQISHDGLAQVGERLAG